MTLPSSGPLSIGDIAGEFGGAVPHSLSEYYGAAYGIPASGALSISNFYGKAKPYVIPRSLLFTTTPSYFYRDPAAGNAYTWTFSCWIYRNVASVVTPFISAGDNGADNTHIAFQSPNTYSIRHEVSNSAGFADSTSTFTSTSQWYHFITQFNSLAGTVGERYKIYYNGVQQGVNYTGTLAGGISYGLTSYFNQTVRHYIGRIANNGIGGNMYLADVMFIDGAVVAHTDFGTFETGSWKPKLYEGSYGARGYWVDFRDPTNTTTLGYDYSGNSNHYSPVNVSTGHSTTASPTN